MCDEEEVKMTTNTVEKPLSNSINENLVKALREVELIQNGCLPKKTARDFLRQSRKK